MTPSFPDMKCVYVTAPLASAAYGSPRMSTSLGEGERSTYQLKPRAREESYGCSNLVEAHRNLIKRAKTLENNKTFIALVARWILTISPLEKVNKFKARFVREVKLIIREL